MKGSEGVEERRKLPLRVAVVSMCQIRVQPQQMQEVSEGAEQAESRQAEQSAWVGRDSSLGVHSVGEAQEEREVFVQEEWDRLRAEADIRTSDGVVSLSSWCVDWHDEGKAEGQMDP